MAPLIQASDISPSSSHDELFDHKSSTAPLHENARNEGSPRRVSFVPVSITYDVMSKDDYSPDEFKASWFDLEEMRRMKEDARSTVKLYGSGSLVPDDEEVSMRGLEHRTREGMKRKRKARMNSYGAVFFELAKQQRNNTTYSEEMVAQSYSFYTQHSAKVAHSVAKQDAVEAIAIHRQDRSDSFGTDCFRKVIVDIISSRPSKD